MIQVTNIHYAVFTGPKDATKSDEDTVGEDVEDNINEMTGNMFCYVANSVHRHADGWNKIEIDIDTSIFRSFR